MTFSIFSFNKSLYNDENRRLSLKMYSNNEVFGVGVLILSVQYTKDFIFIIALAKKNQYFFTMKHDIDVQGLVKAVLVHQDQCRLRCLHLRHCRLRLPRCRLPHRHKYTQRLSRHRLLVVFLYFL